MCGCMMCVLWCGVYIYTLSVEGGGGISTPNFIEGIRQTIEELLRRGGVLYY